MRNKSEALLEVSEALEQGAPISIPELFEILEIEDNEPFESMLEKLLDAPVNDKLDTFPKAYRLSIIKTCQILIGELFI